MKAITYFSVFEPTKTGYGVFFPDLPGCVTVGKDIGEAVTYAKEALNLHLWGMEKDGDQIPEPTNPPFKDIEEGCFIMPIEIYPELFKNEMENKAVKKTLTIPYWLNDVAEQKGVNFSHLLQSALKEYLHV